MGNSASSKESNRDKFLIFEDNTKLINQLLYHISDRSVGVDFCEIRQRYENIEALPHNTESNAQILFVNILYKVLNDIHKTPVVIKSFVGPEYAKYDDSAYVEARIYMHVISKILDYNYSPNIISPLAHVKCRGIVKKLLESSDAKNRDILDDNVDRLIADAIKRAHNRNNDRLVEKIQEAYRSPEGVPLDMLILEKAVNSETFFDWCMGTNVINGGNKINEENFLSAVFQILYTLECFNRFKLRHNDLHGGNIFVQETSKKSNDVYLEYRVDGQSYYIPSQYLALIYDFDRASTDAYKNKSLDKFELCKDYAQCNGHNPKYDTFKFTMSLPRYAEKLNKLADAVDDFLKRHVAECLYTLQYNINNQDKKMFLRYTDLIKEIENLAPEHAPSIIKDALKAGNKLLPDGDYTPPDSGPLRMDSTLLFLKDEIFDRFKTLPTGGSVLKTYKLPPTDASNMVDRKRRNNTEDKTQSKRTK